MNCPTDVTTIDEQMMARAIELAAGAAARGEVPVGAVIYRGSEVIAEASNQCEADDDATAHAEMLAIRAASKVIGDWRLEECSLVVTLEPCAMCAGAIVNARVGRVVYGAADPKAGAVESLFHLCSDERLNHRPPVIGGVMSDACGDLLRQFFRERRAAKKAQKQGD